jgi:hypothetical protein
MLGTLFDKVTGLFDKRFTLALLLPTFAFTAGAGALVATLIGWHPAVAWWAHLDAARQVALGVGAAGGIVVLAIIIGTQVVSMTRLLEGYWPLTQPGQLLGNVQLGRRELGRLKIRQRELGTLKVRNRELGTVDLGALVRQRERARFERLEPDTSPLGYQRMYRYFPANPAHLMPTRLGNAMRAAETYPGDPERWGIDAVFWWPRLYLVLPDSARGAVDDARMGLDQLVVLSELGFSFGIVAFILSCAGLNLAAGLGCGFGGLLLSWGSYRAAVTAATSFGELMRSCYDLYRGDLLGKLGWPIPDTLAEERTLWQALGQQFYRRSVDNGLEPFINGSRKPPAPPAGAR